ncbi:hypothetical protein DPEC_G00157060 [Dallia pectoralis]|uniref:Uncharacterized protein n=1 Tax=Dallia pectoralis TaxID=75939 RepID=A0ACC2GKW4_DALPE|nr:hypothetical protein DPEC_G00157060 [Dallia pectoralis]
MDCQKEMPESLFTASVFHHGCGSIRLPLLEGSDLGFLCQAYRSFTIYPIGLMGSSRRPRLFLIINVHVRVEAYA